MSAIKQILTKVDSLDRRTAPAWPLLKNDIYGQKAAGMVVEVAGGAGANQRAQQEKEGDIGPTVLFENEKVKIIKHVIRPGERNELKERGDRVQYFLKSCFSRYTHLDGRVEEIKYEAGKAYFRKADHMSRENIGDTENEHLVVFL